MARKRKLWTLLLLGTAVVAAILLAGGLSQLELLPGQPLPSTSDPILGSGESKWSPLLQALLRATFAILVVLLPVSIIYFIISPQARKRVLRDLVLIFLLLAAYHFLMRARPEIWGGEADLQPPDALEQADLPSIESFVANPPPWLVLAATLGLALILAAALVGLGWIIWHRYRRRPDALERLTEQAQTALGALQSGADLRDTIMRCYYEMGRVVNEQHGIRRPQNMTPREFERRLAEAGLPGEHVRRLTRLFEAIRYGPTAANEQEEREAVACLQAIIEASGIPV